MAAPAFHAGDYFGQHALFGDQHLSDAVAETEGVLYKMLAGDLRTAMERNSGLYEILLQEKRAGRLRSIPLLRTLTDSQIMRIAWWWRRSASERNESRAAGGEAWAVDHRLRPSHRHRPGQPGSPGLASIGG